MPEEYEKSDEQDDIAHELEYDPTTGYSFDPKDGPPSGSRLEYDYLLDQWYDPDGDPWVGTAWIGLPNPPLPSDRRPSTIGTVENLWAQQDGFVYILSGGGYYKIGCTKDMPTRVRTLRIQLPFEVELFNTIRCIDYKAAEYELHQKFKEKRANGEWFRLDDKDVSLLQDIYFIDGRFPTLYDMRGEEL